MALRLPLMPGRRFSPIGVELAAGGMRAVQLRRTARGWTLLDRVELTRPDPARPYDLQDTRRLAATLARRRFAGHRVVVSLPHRDTFRGLLEVTHEKGGDPLSIAAQDVERTHQLTPGSYELAAWLPPVTGQRRQTPVCVTGCTHALAQQLLQQFDAVGLDITAVDSRAYALSRVLDSDTPGAGHITVAIDTDADGGELILLHGGAVLYQRPLLDAGFDHARRRLENGRVDARAAAWALRRCGFADRDSAPGRRVAEALRSYCTDVAREVHPALDYASRLFTNLPIKRFALVGECGSVPLLGYELCQQLRLEPAVTQPPAVVDHQPDATLAVALGLTLHPEEASWAAA